MRGDQQQCGTVLASGRRSEVLAWEPGQVLKLYLPDRSAGQVAAEAAYTRCAYEQGLPVPAVHGVLERSGRHGLVLDRVDGPSLDKLLRRRIWTAARLGRELALLHARVHGASGEGLPAQRTTLARRIRAPSSPLAQAGKDAAVERLALSRVPIWF